jgi:hypothetical protein
MSVDWIVKRKGEQLVVVGMEEKDEELGRERKGEGGVGGWFRLKRRGGGKADGSGSGSGEEGSPDGLRA